MSWRATFGRHLQQDVYNEEEVNSTNYKRSVGHPVLYGQQAGAYTRPLLGSTYAHSVG